MPKVNFIYKRFMANGYSAFAVIEELRKEFPEMQVMYNKHPHKTHRFDPELIDLEINLDQYSTITEAFEESHKLICENIKNII